MKDGAMTTASVRTQAGPAGAGQRATDPLASLRLVLDRELLAVRRHALELAGRVPEQVAPYVDRSRGMLEFLVDDGAGGVVALAVAPGARGDTVVPVLPAPQPDPGVEDALDVTDEAPFDEIVGEAVEDVSRVITHVEHPDEMRGLVLHLGGRMLMVYADLWELRVTLLP
jgi:hypothetical protein